MDLSLTPALIAASTSFLGWCLSMLIGADAVISLLFFVVVGLIVSLVWVIRDRGRQVTYLTDKLTTLSEQSITNLAAAHDKSDERALAIVHTFAEGNMQLPAALSAMTQVLVEIKTRIESETRSSTTYKETRIAKREPRDAE
jgi:predicted PurR-regulated permease PerM